MSRDTSQFETVVLHGMPLHVVNEAQCNAHIVRSATDGIGGWVITANLDHLQRYQHDPEYRRFCEDASLVVADGRPLLWAATVQGTPLPGLVAGSNMIASLSRAASEAKLSLFLLGGEPTTAERAATILHERYGVTIAGTHYPEYGFERDPAQVQAMCDAIRASNADIVYVALGSPKQERLIATHRDLLPNAWWIGVGISFSYLCGETRRAPRWMQRTGLEWLHRLAHDPHRLFKRYVLVGIPFAIRLFARAAWKRVTKSRDGSGPERTIDRAKENAA